VTFHCALPIGILSASRSRKNQNHPTPHPKRPVMYASVRGSLGVVNNCGVALNSIICPSARMP